eukprot:Gb_38558 [translate_table: standard]
MAANSSTESSAGSSVCKEKHEKIKGHVASVVSPVLQQEVTLIMPIFKEMEENIGDNSSQRGQWLRAAVLGANDGLVSTASLMMGVGAVKPDARAMVLSGLAGLVAGACSMAIGEFVSVYSQLDSQLSHIKRENESEASRRSSQQIITSSEMQAFSSSHVKESTDTESNVNDLPNPIQAACASAMAFTVGALVPLLSAAFIKEHWVRVGVVVGVSSLALATFGGVGAYIGKSPMLRSVLRVLLGGWAAMLITYAMLKLFGSAGI